MILLDTCTLLWLVVDQSGLSETAKAVLRSHSGQIYVSPVTAFEIGQKYARGKLKLKLTPSKWFPRVLEWHGLTETNFPSQVGLAAAALPDLHRDPFDRLLVATAQWQNLTLLTPDPMIRQYPGLETKW